MSTDYSVATCLNKIKNIMYKHMDYKYMDNKDENIKPSEEAQEVEPPISEPPPSQLQLIKQWRAALSYLINDIKFDKIGASKDEAETAVREGIEYLDKKNTLLDENDDFQLSESGFSTYKSKHMLVFDYLSNITKHETKNTSSKFYWFSIGKHLEQQLLPNNWKHSLIHLLMIPLLWVVFFVIGALMVKQTQSNMIVNIFLFLCFTSQFSVVADLFKMVKKSAATPFKFKLSLLSIHLLNTLRTLFWVCLLPIALASKFQPYWVDDVIIISLLLFYFFMFKVDGKLEQESSNPSPMKEANDA